MIGNSHNDIKGMTTSITSDKSSDDDIGEIDEW